MNANLTEARQEKLRAPTNRLTIYQRTGDEMQAISNNHFSCTKKVGNHQTQDSI